MNAASQLGKLAAGVPKKFSAAEIAKRQRRLAPATCRRRRTGNGAEMKQV